MKTTGIMVTSTDMRTSEDQGKRIQVLEGTLYNAIALIRDLIGTDADNHPDVIHFEDILFSRKTEEAEAVEPRIFAGKHDDWEYDAE